MIKAGRFGQLNQVVNTAAATVTTDISNDEFKEILPDMLFALNSFAKSDSIDSQSVPFGKHYDNIRVNGTDYIEPQLMENYRYICEYLYE